MTPIELNPSPPPEGWALRADDAAQLARAAQLLGEGALVAFPTETVWGLGALAHDAAALERLYVAKGRGKAQPSTLLCESEAQSLALFHDVTPPARQLAQLWPGPLTLIGVAAQSAPEGPRAGGRTIGARVPDHPAPLALLRAVGAPIAAPSANPAGLPPASSAAQVWACFGDQVAAALVGPGPQLGVASTIVDISGPLPRVLREGAISASEIERLLG